MPELGGFWYPRSPGGAASIIPPPPWHYSGDVLTIEYRTEPGGVARWLPPGVEPAEDDPDAVALIFADWQSCGPDGAELLDPVRSQYKEAFVVVRCRHRDETYSRCILIWVDKDFALARGWFQGYPKKLGSIWMTRPVTVGRAGPRLLAGGVLAATLAANDRRLADVRVTLEGPSDAGGFVNALPMLHSRWLPAIAAKAAGDAHADLVTMRSSDVELGPVWRGTADVELHEAPGEELASLPVIEPIAAYWRQVGATFTGGEALGPDV
jgi:acetoacetate decarboxylase